MTSLASLQSVVNTQIAGPPAGNGHHQPASLRNQHTGRTVPAPATVAHLPQYQAAYQAADRLDMWANRADWYSIMVTDDAGCHARQATEVEVAALCQNLKDWTGHWPHDWQAVGIPALGLPVRWAVMEPA